MEEIDIDPQLAEDIAHIPNAETIAALEEGDRIANDPTRKTYDNLDKFWADLER